MRLIAGVFCILFMAGAVAGGVLSDTPDHSQPYTATYEGKETFETNEEYADYKRAMGRTDVDIISESVMHSDPPVIASFIVTAEEGVQFPYGAEVMSERHYPPKNSLVWGGTFIGCIIAATIALWIAVGGFFPTDRFTE